NRARRHHHREHLGRYPVQHAAVARRAAVDPDDALRGGQPRRRRTVDPASDNHTAAAAAGRTQHPAARTDLHLQGFRPDLRDDRRWSGRCDDRDADLHLSANVRILQLRYRCICGRRTHAGHAWHRDGVPLVQPARGGAVMAPTWRTSWGKTILASAIVAVYLFPVYWMVTTSLKSPADVFASPPQLIPVSPVLTAYREAVFSNSVVQRAMFSSLVIATGTMLLTLLLATPAAYALARLRLRGSGVVILLLVLSQLLPAIVVAGPLFVMFSRVDLTSTYQAIILADVSVTLQFAVIILRPYFLTVPRELEAASMLDGSTQFGAFRNIV